MKGVSRLRARLAVRAGLLSAAALALVAAVIEFGFVRPLLALEEGELDRRMDSLAAIVAEGGREGFERRGPAWIRPGREEFAALLAPGGAFLAGVGRALPPGAEAVAPGTGASVEDPVSGEFRVMARSVAAPGGARFVVEGGLSVQEARDRQRETRLLVAAAAAAAALLTAAGAWFGAGLVLDPLRGMTEAAAAGAPGMETRLPVRDPGDEFDDLARLLNGLLARVGAALEEERRFAGEAAHELRSPLSVMRLRAEEAIADGAGGEARKALAGVLADVERVDRLVQALLELSRAGPGAAGAGPARVDAAAILASLAGDFGTLAASRGLAFEARIPPGLPAAAAPREVVEAAVSVLVDNAFRYTPRGGRVEVEASGEGGRVRVRVRDTGPGIPPEERERVFDRLFRGRVGKASGSGFGLGLALARRLARSAGGDVVLESPGPPGACFTVDLPAAG